MAEPREPRPVLDELRALAEAATPGPWSYNSYSAIAAPSLFAADEAFWDAVPDDHSGDRYPRGNNAVACEPCEGACSYHRASLEVESLIASVPTVAGDTAIGRQAADAAFIAAANPAAVLELLAENARLVAENERQAALIDECREAWAGWKAWCDAPVIHDDSGSVAKDRWIASMDALGAAAEDEQPPDPSAYRAAWHHPADVAPDWADSDEAAGVELLGGEQP